MAFGLSATTGIKAYGVQSFEGNREIFEQVLLLEVTGVAADVLLDIGASGGTFWTNVNNATLNRLVQDIFTRVDKHVSFSCPQLLDRTQVRSSATVATTQFKIASPQNTSFAITLFAGEGLTNYSIALRWTLKSDHPPVIYTP
jgi:hypothetical protein